MDSFEIVLANGQKLTASRHENSDLFFSAIGGIGVITEVTLNLAKNERIRREVILKPVSEYKDYFYKNIRNNKKAMLHNSDIYPPRYNLTSLKTWYKTRKALTEKTRLFSKNRKYWLEPNVISSISMVPFGTEIRKKIIDPIMNSRERVVLRNFEASYDVAMLEPNPKTHMDLRLTRVFYPS